MNRSKEKGGTTRLSVSGRVPRKCPHHGTSYNQWNIFKVVGKANDFKKFSCKRSIPKELWDTKGNCAKGKSKEAREINFALDDIKAQIIKHYQRLSDREAFVTAEMVRNAYQGIGNEYETLLGAYDKDNANLVCRCFTVCEEPLPVASDEVECQL